MKEYILIMSIIATISSNNVLSNDADILLDGSNNNIITGNNVNNNVRNGILLKDSGNNTLTNNTISGREFGSFGVYGSSPFHHNQTIDTSNTVNGRPIYYWVNQQNRQIPNDAGFVGVVNSTNITVRDLTLTNNTQGVLFAYTTDSRIENVTTSNNFYGIVLYFSNNNTLSNSIANSNSQWGIYLISSSNNTLSNNTASDNMALSTDGGGICLEYSSYSTLSNNNASSNAWRGINLECSSNNNLTNNTMSGNMQQNFFIGGSDLSHFTQTIDTSNTVNGRPIYYWVNKQNQQVPDDAGFVGVVNSTNITVSDTNNYGGILFAYATNSRIENVNASIYGNYGISLLYSSNNTLSNNTVSTFNDYSILLYSSSNNMLTNNTVSNSDYSFLLDDSSDNTLTNNTASNNDCGIYLEKYSSSNIFTGNNASNNDNYGIYLCDSCDNNSIYNNYFNNTNNAWDDGNNRWNITKTLGTNIISGPYLGGNYWSDYAGKDLDGDGLGDTLLPYNSSGSIQNGGDYLPLVPVQKPTVSITTDKFSYKTGDTMTITIDINNPTENIVTFEWYWGVPQFDIWLLVTSVPIPAGYNDTINISLLYSKQGFNAFR